MRMVDLIRGLPVTTRATTLPEVAAITHDSRQAEPGALFVAMPGERYDGRDFAADAAGRGAAAVLGRGEAPEGLQVPWLSTDDPRALLGPLAARLYEHPHRELAMIGVTGTNGKSTVVELVRLILEAAGRPTATLGTLGYRFGEMISGAERTTPEASELLRMLRTMRDAGAEAAAMEVSSHALSLSRVEGVTFDVAVFTNLSRDHLDFHGDLEGYFAAKKRLFDQLETGGRAVVGVGDRWGRRLAEALPEATTFGAGGDVAVEVIRYEPTSTRGVLATPAGRLEFHTGLLGPFNVENLLAAVAAAVSLGVEKGAIHRALAEARPLPGRLEPVVAGQPFPLFIDYAHTPAALESAIEAVRTCTGREVLVVFGCGGDRDPGKRSQMGEAAGREGDFVIATSDNPRSEDPATILAQVTEGLERAPAPWETEVDRRRAIGMAVERAARSDDRYAVLVAGKGHEEVQLVGDRVLPFSDRLELTAAVEERFGAGTAD